VTGIDTDPDRVSALNAGRSHSPDVRSEDLTTVLVEGRYEATTDSAALGRADVVIICVPTPLGKSKDPDISFVIAAASRWPTGSSRDSWSFSNRRPNPGPRGASPAALRGPGERRWE